MLFILLLLLSQEPRITPGQSVYIVALQSNSADISFTSLDLTTEREIKNGFKKRGVYKVVPSLNEADFVFFIIVQYDDSHTLIKNILALAVSREQYIRNKNDLAQLRNSAFWQSDRAARVRVKLKSVLEDFHKAH
ncbi:MAG TPA: hypothetical protein VK619_10335 [Pyrinomonadaceae bacterium]|nr:hypothetical protein [Pyrinomonadaceae bacterium]